MRTLRLMKGAATLLLCITLVSATEGCTAIGFALGAQADSKAGKGGPEIVRQLKMGQPVTLFLRDGQKLEGRFAGWVRDPDVASAAADSLVPGKESVKLSTGRGEVTIHPEAIASVSISVNHGKITGLLVGAALDVIAVSAFIYGMEQSVSSAFGP